VTEQCVSARLPSSAGLRASPTCSVCNSG
jgi:hypothetical protein